MHNTNETLYLYYVSKLQVSTYLLFCNDREKRCVISFQFTPNWKP